MLETSDVHKLIARITDDNFEVTQTESLSAFVGTLGVLMRKSFENVTDIEKHIKIMIESGRWGLYSRWVPAGLLHETLWAF